MTAATAEVPSSIDDVTPQWLTEVLDGATVTDVRAERIAEDTGFSALLYRLHLTGTAVPSTVIVKLAAQSEARGAMELLGGYKRELSFYRMGRRPRADRHPARLRRAAGRRLSGLRPGARRSA